MKINKKKLLHSMVDAEMTSKTLSEISGVSLPTIARVRLGSSTTYDTALKIAKALNTDVNALIESEG